MTRTDLRSGAWRKIREARKLLSQRISRALREAQAADDRGDVYGTGWWYGRVDGLQAADTDLMAILEIARAKRRRAKR